ncbi:SIS domain-containing protein [Thiocapsa imhoffii]|nr:SIS domain-containing protein [Thiocapsa imhoffii]
MNDRFEAHLDRHISLATLVRDTLGPAVTLMADRVIATLAAGHKIMLCGNGGSAADAQHIAAELTGRYGVPNRRALAALALSTDSSALTAISNDLGFDQVFARQLEALSQRDDLLIAISTSGRSPNLIAAVERARHLGLYTIGLLGGDGGALRTRVDLPILVPSSETPHIQELHITLGHILCSLVDEAFHPDRRDSDR